MVPWKQNLHIALSRMVLKCRTNKSIYNNYVKYSLNVSDSYMGIETNSINLGLPIFHPHSLKIYLIGQRNMRLLFYSTMHTDF